MKAQRGFTLVEVLVALLVLSIMAAMAWQGVDGIVRTRDASQRQLERTLRLQTVLAQWQTDLAAVQDTGAVPPLVFDGATLRMTRGTPEGVQVVAWSLKPESNDNAWRRWASASVTTGAALQDSWFASQQLMGSEPGQLRTVEGVSQWQVYFFQGNAWSNAQSTGNVATPPAGAASGAVARQALPSGVRVVLSFAPGSGMSGTPSCALGGIWPCQCRMVSTGRPFTRSTRNASPGSRKTPLRPWSSRMLCTVTARPAMSSVRVVARKRRAGAARSGRGRISGADRAALAARKPRRVRRVMEGSETGAGWRGLV